MPEGAATQTEIVFVAESVVACDGGEGLLGHPRVFLHLLNNEVVCPYCSRRFVRKPGVGRLGPEH
ncbi:MAG: zinc-finger domain-containing protein [Acetobacteraceae bacterium]